MSLETPIASPRHGKNHSVADDLQGGNASAGRQNRARPHETPDEVYARLLADFRERFTEISVLPDGQNRAAQHIAPDADCRMMAVAGAAGDSEN